MAGLEMTAALIPRANSEALVRRSPEVHPRWRQLTRARISRRRRAAVLRQQRVRWAAACRSLLLYGGLKDSGGFEGQPGKQWRREFGVGAMRCRWRFGIPVHFVKLNGLQVRIDQPQLFHASPGINFSL